MHVGLLHDMHFVWSCVESVWVTVWDKHRTSEQTAVDIVHECHDNFLCATVLHYL